MRILVPILALLLYAATASAEVPAALASAARRAAATGDPGELWRAVVAQPDFVLEGDDVVELARAGLGPRLEARDMDTLFLHHATRLTKRGATVTIERTRASDFQVERPDRGEPLSSRVFRFFVGARVQLEVVCDAAGVSLKTSGLSRRSVWDDPARRVKVRAMRFERRAGGGALWTTTLGNWRLFTTRTSCELRAPAPGIVSALPGRASAPLR